jgi:EF hand
MFKLWALPAVAVVSLSVWADQNTTADSANDSNTQARAVQQPTFESLDRNGDHQISRTEAGVDRRLAEDFAYIDTDGDGYISAAEYAARTR